MAARPLPSLKGQALALLARREHSRAELRTKLLAHARKRAAAAATATAAAAGATATAAALGAPPEADAPDLDSPEAHAAQAAEVDALLDELQAARHLSDQRFAEARVHSRAARQGSARIRQELARHGITLDPDTAQQLRDTEAERARAVWQRKFGGQPPASPTERARQQRFLAARGFAAEVVWRIVGGRDDS